MKKKPYYDNSGRKAAAQPSFDPIEEARHRDVAEGAVPSLVVNGSRGRKVYFYGTPPGGRAAIIFEEYGASVLEARRRKQREVA